MISARYLVLGLCSMLALMGASIWFTIDAVGKWRGVRETERQHERLAQARYSMLDALHDAEIGHRGYLLTRLETYLAQYAAALAKLGASKQQVADAIARQDGRSAARLVELVDAKAAEIRNSIDRVRLGDSQGALGIVLADRSNLLRDEILAVLADAHGRAERDLADARADAEVHERRMRGAAIATIAIAGAFMLLLIALLAAGNRRLGRDLTLRVQMIEDLREAQQRHQALFDQSGDLLFIVDCANPEDCVYETINKEVEKLFGRSAAEVRGKRHHEIMGDEAGKLAQANFTKCVRSGGPVRYESVAGPDNRSFDVVLMPLRDAAGNVTRILGSARDMTNLKRAEEALLQAQKLEAIGQLTGGIAHDFNNLLQVILGNLEMLAPMLSEPTLIRRVHTAILAAERGHGLTQHLLAFARQQPLKPQALDVGSVLHALGPMIRASLGERVTLVIDIEPDVRGVRADRTLFDTALLNLVVNSGDAMPEGGTLRIRARKALVDPELAPRSGLARGEYVELSVIDTGCGIPREILGKVFQPFFTTKSVGRGTGLGLSLIYGFAKQSAGAAEIESVVGAGTTVTILLPHEAIADVAVDSRAGAAPGGTEAILVVEDDAAVRAIVVEMLRALGYSVTDAAGPEAALALLRNGCPVDLLLTDIVMPGPITGPELARQGVALRPHLRVLLSSGHAEDRKASDSAAAEEFDLLKKPYRRDELALRVRAALDRSHTTSRAPPASVPAEAATVLVVEDQHLVRLNIVETLAEAGFRTVEAGNAMEALRHAAGVRVAIVDLGLPDMDGRALLARMKELHPQLLTIVSSGSGAAPSDLPGVFAVLPKPHAPAALVGTVRNAMAAAMGAANSHTR